MTGNFNPDRRRQIKAALARVAYRDGAVRIAEPQLADAEWLIASDRGVFALGPSGVRTVLYGWFFGIHRHEEHLYLFENCAMRDRSVDLGRIVRLTIAQRRLVDPQVLVTGLHPNCHQLAVIGGLLCLLDTANQTIRRYHLDGVPVDAIVPFPVAEPTDTSGGYLHINSLAQIGERIALLLHNGIAKPERNSELVWFDAAWNLITRASVPGRCCHDIVADANGTLWHSASQSGELIASDGRRFKLTDRLMTRGIAFADERMLVGLSSFGPRQLRDELRGSVALLDRDCRMEKQIELPGSPTDIVAIGQA